MQKYIKIFLFGYIYFFTCNIYAYTIQLYEPFSNAIPSQISTSKYNYNHSNHKLNYNTKNVSYQYKPISIQHEYMQNYGGGSYSSFSTNTVTKSENNIINNISYNGNIKVEKTNEKLAKAAGDVYVYTVIADDGTVFNIEWRHGTINIFGTKYEVGNVYVVDDDGLNLRGSYLSESTFMSAVQSALDEYNKTHRPALTPIDDIPWIFILMLLFFYLKFCILDKK